MSFPPYLAPNKKGRRRRREEGGGGGGELTSQAISKIGEGRPQAINFNG